PGRRYLSARALADDLKRWLAGEPTEVRPPRWPRRAWRVVRRHPVLLVATALGVLGTACGIGLLYFLDPDRPVRELEGQLAGGRPAELIGDNGPPRWWRWQTGADGGQTSVGPDGTFSVHTWTLSLVELLRDPRCDRYHICAEVRHRRGSLRGEVG